MKSHVLRRAIARAASARRSRVDDGPSGSVWAAVGAWYVQASALLLVGLAVDALPPARGLVGVSMVRTEEYRPWGVLLVILGFASLLLIAFLLLGHGFAVPALAGVGALGAVVLAVVGSWVAIVMPAAMLVAIALVLLTPALDHLSAPTEVAER